MIQEIENIKNAISNNNLKEAFSFLEKIVVKTEYSHLSSQVKLQKDNLQLLEETIIKGDVSKAEVKKRQKKIGADILKIINSIEKKALIKIQSALPELSPVIITDLHINKIISIERRSHRVHVATAIIILLIGIFLAIYGLLVLEESLVKGIYGAGGALLSVISGFPIRELLKKGESISVWKMLKNQLVLCNEKYSDQKECSKIQELIWKKIENITLT